MLSGTHLETGLTLSISMMNPSSGYCRTKRCKRLGFASHESSEMNARLCRVFKQKDEPEPCPPVAANLDAPSSSFCSVICFRRGERQPLRGRIVKDGVRKTVTDRQITLDMLLKAIREFRKFTDQPLTLRGGDYAHAVQELNKAIDPSGRAFAVMANDAFALGYHTHLKDASLLRYSR